MKENNGDISIKEAMDELLETSIFKNITKRNDERFSKKLAVWLVRYILVISKKITVSMTPISSSQNSLIRSWKNKK
jgi:hypothetical protein